MKDDENRTPEQVGFFDVPRARNSWRPGGVFVRDPGTSFEAARSVTGERVTALQRAILSVLTLKGPLTDEQIVAGVIESSPNLSRSDSSIRSRRAELARRGRVEVADETGRTTNGRACQRWRVVRDGES